MTACWDTNWHRKLTSTLVDERVDVHRPEHHKVVWFWPLMLLRLVSFLVWEGGAPPRTPFWEALEVWLEHGASPPLDIQHGRISKEEWKATQAERKAKRAALPLNCAPSDDGEGDEWDTMIDSDACWEFPGDYILFRLPVIQSSTTRMAVDILDLQAFNRYDPLREFGPHLLRPGYITFADLIRYHNPPNAKALLSYVDRSQAWLDEYASSHDDPSFTSDGLYMVHNEASTRAMARRPKEKDLTRERPDGLSGAESP